ncbi:MAG TPA: mechanosensitive ion channel family protein [Gemmatimonadaceae bacterium]
MTPQVQSWLIAAATVVGLTALTRLVQLFLVNRVGSWAARTRWTTDDLVLDLVRRISLPFLLAMYANLSIVTLALPAHTRTALHWLFIAACVYQAGVWGNGVIGYLVARRRAAPDFDGGMATTLGALGFGVRVLLWSALILLGLQNAGVNVSAALTGLGIGGVAVALAVQNILSDIFASVAIVLDRPFVIGDFITVGDLLGTVEHIGLKTTRLRSLYGEQLVLSNAQLLQSSIKNYKRMQERRVTFGFGVTYDTPRSTVARIPGMVRRAVEQQGDVRFDRAHFQGFGESALKFEVVYYVLSPDYNRYMDIQQAINLEIMEQFEGEEIEFAFPTRTVLTPDVSAALREMTTR